MEAPPNYHHDPDFPRKEEWPEVAKEAGPLSLAQVPLFLASRAHQLNWNDEHRVKVEAAEGAKPEEFPAGA